MTVAAPETTEHVTIFYADWCPFCAKLLKGLNRAETPYALVDAEDAVQGLRPNSPQH